jgi:Domain of Unknown Function with PDB structure (DUF3862)
MTLRKIRHLLMAAVALVVIAGGVGVLGRSMSAVHGQEPGDGSNDSASDEASGSDKDSKLGAEPKAKLQENLKDRREMLLKAFNLRMEQWRAGKVTLDPLKDDLRALVKVIAELFSTKKERVAGVEECVKLARDLAKVTDAKAGAGLVTEADGLEVKVLLLEIQAELLREQNKPVHARDLNSLTRENYDKIKPGTTTYKQVVELLGEPDGTNRPLARGEWLQAIWVVGSRRINVVFDNDVVKLKGPWSP